MVVSATISMLKRFSLFKREGGTVPSVTVIKKMADQLRKLLNESEN